MFMPTRMRSSFSVRLTMSEFETLHEIVKAAHARIGPETWDYLIGAADTETTFKRNRLALDSLAFRPRVLRKLDAIDCGGSLLGHKLRLPILLAPIGSIQDFCDGGGLAPAQAAAEFGVMHMLSSSCDPGLEAVAQAVDHPKIFQLYVRGDAAFVDDHLRRAIDAGYTVFCFTVDLDHYGRRERDIIKRYKPTARRLAGGWENQMAFCWDDVKRVQDNFDIPLIIKGIATAEDAAIAAEQGITAVYVSNHGGRQLDQGRGGIDVLPEVVAAVQGRAQVIFDGGVMRGADVVKAMILGADAVGIGRLQGLGAAAAGKDGIVRVLEILEMEIEICLALLGVTSFDQLNASYIHAAPAVAPAHLLSAFPLLAEDY